MLTQYKNIEQIRTAVKSTTGNRLEKTKTDLLSYSAVDRVVRVPHIVNANNEFRTELHIYSSDSWITGNHKIQLQSKIPEYRDTVTNQLIQLPGQPIAIDLYKEFDNF